MSGAKKNPEEGDEDGEGYPYVVQLDEWLSAVARMAIRLHRPEIFLQEDLVLHGYQPLCGLAFQKMHDIYSADPDLVGIYHNLKSRIEKKDFEDEAHEYACKALYEVAKEYIEKAEREARR